MKGWPGQAGLHPAGVAQGPRRWPRLPSLVVSGDWPPALQPGMVLTGPHSCSARVPGRQLLTGGGRGQGARRGARGTATAEGTAGAVWPGGCRRLAASPSVGTVRRGLSAPTSGALGCCRRLLAVWRTWGQGRRSAQSGTQTLLSLSLSMEAGGPDHVGPLGGGGEEVNGLTGVQPSPVTPWPPVRPHQG